MGGALTIEEGSLYDVLDFFACNLMPRLHDTDAVMLPSVYQNNVVGKAKANVAFHYDLNRALFELFSTVTCNIRVRTSAMPAKLSNRRS